MHVKIATVFFLCKLLVIIATTLKGDTKSPSILPYESWYGKRVTFIYAHIDDMEGAAGGLASLLAGKSEVSLIIMTNSDKGCGNVDICTNKTATDVAQIRQQEQLNSVSILSISPENVHFLAHEDCLLSTYSDIELKQELVGYIRMIKPHVVITWDPQPYYDMIPSDGWEDLGFHPDHQTSGKLALDSSWIAHENRLWPQLGEGWKPEEVYFFAFYPNKLPDFYVEITGEPLDKKTQAFLEMKSQFSDTEAKGVHAYFTLLGSRIGSTVGLEVGHQAEAYNYVLW